MKMRFTSLAALAAVLVFPLAGSAAGDKPAKPDTGKGKGGAFVAADTDGDKKLSESEFVTFFSERMGADKAKEAFGKADTNADDFLDRPEFRAHMEKMRSAGGGKKPEGGKKKSGADT